MDDTNGLGVRVMSFIRRGARALMVGATTLPLSVGCGGNESGNSQQNTVGAGTGGMSESGGTSSGGNGGTVSGSGGTSDGTGGISGTGGMLGDGGGTGGASGDGGMLGTGGTGDSGATNCGIPSGYDDDDQCLAPPAPSDGFQLHYGPGSYDNPAEVSKYLVYPTEERVACVYMKTPNAAGAFVRDYSIRVRRGAVFVNAFLMDSAVADSTAPDVGCTAASNAHHLAVSAGHALDHVSPAPEYEGFAQPVNPNAQAGVQVHFLNTSDAPLLAEAWINFRYLDPSPVVVVTDPTEWFGGVGMSVPAGNTAVVSAGGASCSVDSETTLLDLIGQTYANTNRLSVYIDRAQSGSAELVYESYDWYEPPFLRYDSVTVNPLPDPVARSSGGVSGALALHPGDQIRWECEITNLTGMDLRYDDNVYTGDVCNVFGSYAPGNGPWSCLSF